MTAAPLIDLAVEGLTGSFGFGVAGNFAGHLEQAGEAADFAAATAAPEAPKGIFPWYVPGADDFLGRYPLDADRLALPALEPAANLQIEPEAGLICRIEYVDGQVAGIVPQALAAFNDCSIRRPGATLISEKKNWGSASKGLARRAFAVTELDADGASATLRLACFLVRGDDVHEYGVDSPVCGYSYYGTTLLDWVAERARDQREAPPLQDVGKLLAGSGLPERAVIGIGATRYTNFGEQNFLEPDDESVVVLYDSATHSPDQIAAGVANGDQLERASVLRQRVELAG